MLEKINKQKVSGKRKTSIAIATILKGTGKITINHKDYKNLNYFDFLKIEEALRIAKQTIKNINFDVSIQVRGGGEKSQIDACRLALAKSIVKFTGSEELTKAYLSYDRNLLVADIRRKEAYKPGDSKARAKRQTSYR